MPSAAAAAIAATPAYHARPSLPALAARRARASGTTRATRERREASSSDDASSDEASARRGAGDLDGMDLFGGAGDLFGDAPGIPRARPARSRPAAAPPRRGRGGRGGRGPHWTTTQRRRSKSATPSSDRPRRPRPSTDAARPPLDAVVVVEGVNDVWAVEAAVDPIDVVIMKGRYDAKAGHHVVPRDVAAAVAAAAA